MKRALVSIAALFGIATQVFAGDTGGYTASQDIATINEGTAVVKTVDTDGIISAARDGVLTAETDPTVPAWAKAANKPSYGFSEITGTPTTVSGYGITDAKIEGGTITLGSATITPLTSFTETDPVWTADKAKYVQFTDTAFTTATNKAATAVQTVSKVSGAATELTVTQSGTAVTVGLNLSAYAKAADVASDDRVDALEAKTNAWNAAAFSVSSKEGTWDTTANTVSLKESSWDAAVLPTDEAFVAATNKAATAVQTVSKASGAATELTVTQSGTSVTVGLDLAAYAKTADVASDDRVDALEGQTNTWNTAATKAATAVQPGDLATVATSGSYNDLLDKPTIPTVYTGKAKASGLYKITVDNQGFVTNAVLIDLSAIAIDANSDDHYNLAEVHDALQALLTALQ